MRVHLPSRRPGAFWPLLPAALVIVACTLLFRGGGALYFGPADSDLVNYFYPMRVFVHRWLSQGVMPWWDPHVFSGYPVAETQQMALFYPVSLATAALLSPRLGLAALTAVHLALAVGGMGLFLRQGLACSRPGAVLGSVVYGFGALFSIRVAAGHFTVVAALAWWPWAMLGLVRSCRALAATACPAPGGSRGRRAGALLWEAFRTLPAAFRRPQLPWMLLACVSNAMVVLAGSPQYVVYLGWMQVAAALASAPVRQWAVSMSAVALAWTGGLLISAPQWLPTLWYLPYTGRAGTGSSELTPPGTLDLISLVLELILPFPFGDDMRMSHLHLKNVWETATYPGLAALVLTAALVPRALRARAPRRRLPLALLCLAAYMLLGGWLPGFGGFREVLKARAVLAFALATASTAGFEVLRAALMLSRRHRAAPGSGRRPGLPATRLLPELSAAGGLAVLAGAMALIVQSDRERYARLFLRFGPPFDPAAVPFWEKVKADPALATHQFVLSAWAVAAGAALVFGLLLLARRRPGPALGLLVLLGTLEPFAIHSYSFYARHPYEAIELPRPLVEWAKEKLATGSPPWRVTLHPLINNRSHHLAGLYETGGYDPLMPRNANNRIVLPGSISAAVREDAETSARVTKLRHAAFARRYDLSAWHPFQKPLKPLNDATFPPVLEEASLGAMTRRVRPGAPVTGFYGPDITGMNFVVPPEWGERAATPEELPRDFVDRVRAVAEAGPAATEPLASLSPTADLRPGESMVLHPQETPNRFEFDLTLEAPALVFVRTTWLPGWKVRINDGPATRALLANHWNPAALVPAGRHRVTFFYRPAGLIPALAVSALACVLALALLGRGAKRHVTQVSQPAPLRAGRPPSQR